MEKSLQTVTDAQRRCVHMGRPSLSHVGFVRERTAYRHCRRSAFPLHSAFVFTTLSAALKQLLFISVPIWQGYCCEGVLRAKNRRHSRRRFQRKTSALTGRLHSKRAGTRTVVCITRRRRRAGEMERPRRALHQKGSQTATREEYAQITALMGGHEKFKAKRQSVFALRNALRCISVPEQLRRTLKLNQTPTQPRKRKNNMHTGLG